MPLFGFIKTVTAACVVQVEIAQTFSVVFSCRRRSRIFFIFFCQTSEDVLFLVFFLSFFMFYYFNSHHRRREMWERRCLWESIWSRKLPLSVAHNCVSPWFPRFEVHFTACIFAFYYYFRSQVKLMKFLVIAFLKRNLRQLFFVFLTRALYFFCFNLKGSLFS